MDRRKEDLPVFSDRRSGTDRRQTGAPAGDPYVCVSELVEAGNELLNRGRIIARIINDRIHGALNGQDESSSPSRDR